MKLFHNKTGEGKPLIILHGLFGMSDNWMTLSKQFAENGFACYAVDQRNHGRSPHSDVFNYTVMATDLLELMAAEQLVSASIIGHSMGGKTAMFFSCTHPEKIEKLVVADIAPKYYPAQNNNELIALQGLDLNTINSRKEAEANLKLSLHNEATIQFLLKNLYWKEVVNNAVQRGIENADIKKLAWRFNLPVLSKNWNAVGEAIPDDFRFNKSALFLRGEKSGYITDQDIPAIQKQFPKAQLKTITNAGHWLHAENPDEFIKITLPFLAGS